MKQVLICILCSTILFAQDLEEPDANKGQIFYKYFVAPSTQVNGAIFAKKYTKQEWEKNFADNGKIFFAEFGLDKNSISEQNLSHIKVFCILYAKDSDISPNCTEE